MSTVFHEPVPPSDVFHTHDTPPRYMGFFSSSGVAKSTTNTMAASLPAAGVICRLRSLVQVGSIPM